MSLVANRNPVYISYYFNAALFVTIQPFSQSAQSVFIYIHVHWLIIINSILANWMLIELHTLCCCWVEHFPSSTSVTQSHCCLRFAIGDRARHGHPIVRYCAIYILVSRQTVSQDPRECTVRFGRIWIVAQLHRLWDMMHCMSTSAIIFNVYLFFLLILLSLVDDWMRLWYHVLFSMFAIMWKRIFFDWEYIILLNTHTKIGWFQRAGRYSGNILV